MLELSLLLLELFKLRFKFKDNGFVDPRELSRKLSLKLKNPPYYYNDTNFPLFPKFAIFVS
jgi:hypothetical protein